MTNEELNCWDFLDEMKGMAESCVGLSKTTARKKASALYKKYSQLISSDSGYYQKRTLDLSAAKEAVRRGTIRWEGGFVFISEIESMNKNQDSIIITTKSGKTIALGIKSFDWVYEIFN